MGSFSGWFSRAISTASSFVPKLRTSIGDAPNKIAIITPQQIDFYRKNGYVVLNNFFSLSDCEIIQQEIECLLNDPNITHCIPPHKILNMIQSHQISTKIRSYVTDPRTVEVLQQLISCHLANEYSNGGVKAVQSMLFIKPPSFPGQAWHQDEQFLPTRDRSLTGVWIPLEDATVENGTLWVVPQSHLEGIMYPTRKNTTSEFEWKVESCGFDETKAIPIEIPAGSALIFNGYLLHKSLKNNTDRYRRVFSCHYSSMNSLFAPWIPPGSKGTYVGTFDNREVVPLVGVDPYESSGYKEPQFHIRYMNEDGRIVTGDPLGNGYDTNTM